MTRSSRAGRAASRSQGCAASCPAIRRIGYRGLTLEGRTIEREAQGLHARVVQHEVDHLDGILYPMRMPDLSRLSFETELRHFVAESDARGAA